MSGFSHVLFMAIKIVVSLEIFLFHNTVVWSISRHYKMADTDQTVSSRTVIHGENVPSRRAGETQDHALVVRSQTQGYSFWGRFRYPLLAAGFAFLLSPLTMLWSAECPIDPTNYAERTRRVLKTTP